MELQDIFLNSGKQSEWDNLGLKVAEEFAEESNWDVPKIHGMMGSDLKADGQNGARVMINELVISKAE